MSKSLKRVFAFILGVLLTLGFQLGNPVQAGGPDAQGEAVGLKSDDAGWYFGHPGGWPEGPFATAESCEASRALVGGLPCVYWGGSGSTITEKVGLKSSWAMVSKQGTTVNL